MTDQNSEFITLGADVGGKDAFNATNDHVLALRRLLRSVPCSVPPELDTGAVRVPREIALVLRIDGSVQAWRQTGVSNVAVNSKTAIATADVFVPEDVWKNGDAIEIRQFLVEQTKSAICLVGAAVQLQGFALDTKKLERSIEKISEQYLDDR